MIIRTMKDIASCLGVTVDHISRVKAGKKYLSKKATKKLVAFYKNKVEEINLFLLSNCEE